MMDPKKSAALPDDIEELKALLRRQQKELQQKDQTISLLKENVEQLSEQVLLLRKYRFAASSEKWTSEDKQAMLSFDEAEQIAEEDEISRKPPPIQVKSHSRKKRGPKPLPASLPRVEIVHQLPAEELKCENESCSQFSNCTKERPVIGEEITEELDFIPAKIQVIRHIVKKYGTIDCSDHFLQEETPEVVKARKPAKLIPGSIATANLLSHIIVSKFADALPFNRQERILKRINIDISKQTMSNWALNVSKKCEDFILLLRDKARESPILNVDETSVQVLKEPGKVATSLSYMWVVVGRYLDHPIVLYNYFKDKSANSAETLLAGYKGVLQTDGYDGYNSVGRRKEIWHVGCWAHARRKFHEAFKAGQKNNLAEKGLEFIQELHDVHRELGKKDLSPEEFTSKRRRDSVVILRRFRKWLIIQKKIIVPKSLLGKAVSYTLNEYRRLVKYLRYPFITPDNNAAERAIRPFVVGRKNWLFSNTPRGAYASANLYSIVETAKANKLDPYHYCAYLFENLPNADKPEELERLFPWNVQEFVQALDSSGI